MAHVIIEPCIRDGACAEVCPVECIVPGPMDEGWLTYFVDPQACIDCGACAPECPVEAILAEEDVPAGYQTWIAQNREFFETGPGYGIG